MINIYNPNIEKYKNSSLKAINDGWISNHGIFVEKANEKLKNITGTTYSILMANGTCATHCLFLALKFKHPKIKTIYVPNNCYVAAWNAVLMEYDIEQLEVMNMDIDTWNISTNETYIKSLKNNCAVLIVHNIGNIVNVPKLKRLRPDIIFIEDNCEGMFGKYENIYSGISSCSLASACSFYGNKIITTGEGGAFFTQHSDIFNHIKNVYSQGMSEKKYIHKVHAYNYRMTNVAAGFLFEQLNDIDCILKNKYNIFDVYENLFYNLIKSNKVRLIKKENNTNYSPWIFNIRLIGNTKSFDIIQNFFNEHNVDIRPFFYPINYHDHLKCIKNEDNVSYILNKEIIMIPSSPTITIEQQKHVVDVVSRFLIT